MTGPMFSCTLVGCVFAMSLMAQGAKAAEGRIVFSGAIVEPTCSVATESIVTMAAVPSPRPEAHRQTCSMPDHAAAAAPRTYALAVVRLTGSEPDRLLRYFDGYVKTGQVDALHPVLVTQTYE